jgi:hypothetical protein
VSGSGRRAPKRRARGSVLRGRLGRASAQTRWRRGLVGAASSSRREWRRDSQRVEQATEEARMRRAQQRDGGREQGTDAWGRRERLTVGHNHYAGFDKRVTGWVNGPGPLEIRIGFLNLDKGFPML